MVCLSERQRKSWNWLMMSDLKSESVRLRVSTKSWLKIQILTFTFW